MSESANKLNNRNKARGARTAPVIELSASEVIQSETAATVTAPIAEPAIDISPVETQQVEAAQVETEMPPILAVQEKPVKQSLFLPMTFAALIGGILGTIGGSVIPGLIGNIPGMGTNTPNLEVQQLRQQITALATKPAPASPEIEALHQKVQAMEGEIAKRLNEAESKLSGRIQGVEGSVKDLAARPAGSTAATLDLSPLTQRLEKFEKDIGVLGKDIKTVENKAEAGFKASDPKIAAIAQQVEQATRRMSASNSAPYFASVQGLSQAFNTGGPFATELTAVELLGGRAEDLLPLRTLAEKGAPTLAQISARFAPLAGKLAQGDVKSESWAVSILEKFAKVRPVGQVGGSTPADIVSTIEVALGRGDVSSALTSWRRLPEAAKLASHEWSVAAEARDKAAKIIVGMQEAAISALRMAKP